MMKAYNAAEDEVIKKLSKWYKFDAAEAKKRLHSSEEPSVPLPFTGEIKSEWCLGMKKNHNLYSQCTGKRINDRLCNKCQKEEDKLGKLKEGYIEERLSCNLMDYKDVQNYGNVLEKLNITKEKAMEEAARFNIVIPEEQFEVKKKVAQRGRPNNSKQPKEVVLNNKKEEDVKATKKEEKEVNNSLGEGGQASATDGDVNPPKKRGRPKKEQKKVVNNCGEELIAALVNEAQKKETEDVFETAKKAKAEAKKKEQAKQEEQKKQEEAKKKEQAKQEEQKKQEEKKKQEEQAKLEEEKKIVSDELCEEEVEEDESEEDCDEEGVRASATEGNEEFPCEEEITVSKFEFNGIKYLKSSDNILYDPISQDPVGIWNEDDECIDEIEEDDEE